MGAERGSWIARLAAWTVLLAGTAAAHAQAPQPVPPANAPVQLDLQLRLKDVKARHTPEGERLRVPSAGGTVELSPEEFARALAQTQDDLESAGFLYRFFNITRPWSFVWIAVGLLGQAMFTFRMVLQWLASEKEKRSVIPVGFWWGSLLGGILLLAYFIWRKDVVGIIGQSTGVFVYLRNLVLIHRGADASAEPPQTPPPLAT